MEDSLEVKMGEVRSIIRKYIQQDNPVTRSKVNNVYEGVYQTILEEQGQEAADKYQTNSIMFAEMINDIQRRSQKPTIDYPYELFNIGLEEYTQIVNAFHTSIHNTLKENDLFGKGREEIIAFFEKAK